jgi:hypothetical protein
MATHAFVAYKLTVAPGGHPDDLVSLSNIDGRGTDLRYLAHGFIKDINRSPFTASFPKKYLTITSITPSGHAIQFEGEYGPYGQSGNNIIDVQTGKSIHELGDNDAYTTRVRNMIIIPPGSKIGLFLAERHSGRGLASMFLREFGRAFRRKFREEKYAVRWEGLTNGEAWQAFLANAQLARVRVVRHGVSQDIADETNGKSVYDLTFAAKAARRQRYFPRSVRDGLINGTIKPQTILGLSPEMEFDETRLEMHGPDWQKEFALDQRLPVLIYPVGADDQSRPSDDKIYNRMEEVVAELCPTLGVDLPLTWHQGVWSADALAVALEAVRDS